MVCGQKNGGILWTLFAWQLESWHAKNQLRITQKGEPVEMSHHVRGPIRLKQVAQHLGNTPAVCPKSYIHPHLVETYLDCKFHECWRPQPGQDNESQAALSCEELAVLSFLELAL